jgi:fructan beta-fructosidase
MIGWMNNWQYANAIPASGWRGAFSLIRELSLKRTAEGLRLIHQSIPEIESLRNKTHHWQNETLTPGRNLFAGIEGISLEILAEFQLTNTTDQLQFHVCAGEGERTTIGYSAKEKKVFVDRTHSGLSNFHNGFARIHSATLRSNNNLLRLHIFLDQSSVEVFANDGLVVITDCIFPSHESTSLELSVEGDEALINVLDVFQLSPAQYVNE